MIVIEPRFHIVPRYFNTCTSYTNSYTNLGHRLKWWDWFRTGSYYQKCKKWTIKTHFKSTRSFWFRLMHHKSGWVSRSLAKKKGKQI